MKGSILPILKKVSLTLLSIPFCILLLNAQVKYQAIDDLNLLVSGTSTLHDWDMKGAKGECTALFTFGTDGKLATITELTFTAPAEGLKSGHDGMDKNAYKSLKTDKFKHITFALAYAKVNADGTINCIGKLTIAGVTHDAELSVNYRMNHDNSISINGSKKINMFYYKMEPSTFMGGMFKVGDEVNLKFDLTLYKSN
jgi:polyisoprenoid-binding protein YceI